MLRVIVGMSLLLFTAGSFAGEYNPVLSIGDAAPAWSDLPGVDGKKHSQADLKDTKLVVVVFTCNSCPVALDYEDRIIELAQRRPDDLAVVAINVGLADADGLEKMRERAELKRFPFRYIRDESQEIGRRFGAGGTPEFFLLSPERKIVYMGAMDDNAMIDDVKVNYLEPAIDAALAGGTPATAETYAHGCRIRYARQRNRGR